MKTFSNTVELTALVVTTREALRLRCVPDLTRAIALLGNPVSDTRAAEASQLLRAVHAECVCLANLCVHTLKARPPARPRPSRNLPLWEGHLGSGN